MENKIFEKRKILNKSKINNEKNFLLDDENNIPEINSKRKKQYSQI